ncbi:MAG: HD domain-containing protein [Chloroflexota bacterium]|nr:HD domain-containing protein [Chloroflexota bacterium]
MTASSSLLSLLNQANHLKQLPRTGWLFAGVSPVESVADHSFAVALLALFLAETVNATWATQGLAAPLVIEHVIQIALVHDLAESMLTDLPKRSADLLGRSAKHAAEAHAIAHLLTLLPNANFYQQCWTDYARGATPEARLVRDADKLEMVHQALCYARRGQTNLDEFWQGHTWHYAASAALFGELLAAKTVNNF